MGKKLTLEEVNEKISERNIEFLEYNGVNEKSEIVCKKCGHKWKTRPGVVLYLNAGCPKCQKEKASEAIRLSSEEFLKKYDLEKSYEIVGEFKGSSSKFISIFKCKKCGYLRKTSASTVISHRECPNCTKRRKLTQEEFIERVDKIHGKGNYTVLSEYKNLKEKVKIRHNLCGNVFETNGLNFIPFSKKKIPSECPYCKSFSKGEKRIREYLKKNSINFKEQYRFSECRFKNTLPFDFAIFDKNNNLLFLLEYDGIHHFKARKNSQAIFNEEKFKSIQRNDRIKNDFCKKNEIKLIRIPYWKYSKIEEILNSLFNERSTTIESQQ